MNPLFVGPLPPPLHGQSQVTAALVSELSSGGPVRVVNTSGGDVGRAFKRRHRILAHLAALGACLGGESPAYISANSNRGLWLTAAMVALCRLRRREVYVHHHSYDHVRRRRADMSLLCKLGGPRLTHLVLGRAMQDELVRRYPEHARIEIVNNAGFIELGKPVERRLEHGEVVIGHLSNLTRDKGVEVVTRVAINLFKKGKRVRLRIAGPASDKTAVECIESAEAAMGSAFEYVGPLYGDSKWEFFGSIDLFALPTAYRNEAAPMVLLEALSVGVPCVATPIGCIPEMLGDAGGIVTDLSDFESSIQDALERLSEFSPRRQFDRLLAEHQMQVRKLIFALRGTRMEDASLKR